MTPSLRQAPKVRLANSKHTTYRRSTIPMPIITAFPSGANEDDPAKSSKSGEFGLELGPGMGLCECGGKSIESEERMSAAITAGCVSPPGQVMQEKTDGYERTLEVNCPTLKRAYRAIYLILLKPTESGRCSRALHRALGDPQGPP